MLPTARTFMLTPASTRSLQGFVFRGSAVRGLALGFALTLGLAACGDAPDASDEPADEVASAADVPVQLLPSPETAPPAPDARLRIVSPAEGQRFAAGEAVPVQFELEGYELRVPTPTGDDRGLARAPDGQHVHLVVNDQSYRAIYDLADPVMVEDLPEGTHVIRAFPGRDWHESVKTPGAFDQVVVVVGEGEAAPVDGPTVVYSRPQGAYEGAAADSVLVDFYLDGIELADDGYQLQYTLNGDQSFRITEWQPYLLVGLPDGEHTLRLELLDGQGQPVASPVLPVERSFQIRR